MTVTAAVHGDPEKVLAFAERLVRAGGDEPTDRKLAAALGVQEATIRKWRTNPGEGIRLTTLDRIATEHGRHYSAFLPDGEWEATG